MVLQQVYTDENEDKIIEDLAKEWKLSKMNVIKKIIREYQKKTK